MGSKTDKKRIVDNENRIFNNAWENNYLFVLNVQGKPQCLVCLKVIAVMKEYNLRRHYMTNHKTKYDTYTGVARETIVANLKKKMQVQRNMITKLTTFQQSSLLASYVVCNEIAKGKKPLSDGEFVKNCAVKMAKALNENRIANEFEKVSLSRQTVTRRIGDIDGEIRRKLQDVMQNCTYFSIALDESTDVTDVSQLLIFVRVVTHKFEIYEELLEVCSLHGTTKGSDVFNAVKNAIEKFGGFEKISSVTTDGAKSMTGKNIGLVGLLRKDGIEVPAIHCIIHQESLCGKILNLEDIMATVTKITNLIRGGNRSLNHRNFIAYLEEVDAMYGDLLLHTEVRWLSRGKCLERFFGLRNYIVEFLRTQIKTDTKEFEDQMSDEKFLCSLAFLTDITQHLNKLNLQLQGRKQTIAQLVGFVDGFCKKLQILRNFLIKNDFTHFPSCKSLSEEMEVFDFSEYVPHIDTLISEFDRRFVDFGLLRPKFDLFNNPLAANIEEQDPSLQLELCELQTDPSFSGSNDRGVEFWKLLSVEKYPLLHDFSLKICSMFGSTYVCESTFSNMKHIKSKERNRLTDENLSRLLRVSSSEIDVDFAALAASSAHPQVSH